VTEPAAGWRSHSRPNLALRRAKARKIIALVERRRRLAGCRVLEIGTGSGVISAELAAAAGPDGRVVSIDTMDTRLPEARDGYEFRLTTGVALPFSGASFDVVVSNHVVEHVGARTDQQVHLREIARVLAPDGVGYLATPTRWAVVEPHFKVPLLSWVPRRFRDRVVRVARAGDVYDVDPFGRRELERAIAAAGLRATDVTLDAVEDVVRRERPSGVAGRAASVVVRLPERARAVVRPALPTMVFLLERARR
jgi:ubiquinone/menaquinone biosynthesis C-methylase UbiE